MLLRAFVDLEHARRDRALARRCRSSCASTRRSPSAGPGVELLVLGPGVSTGVPIRYDDPREVGPDRIANAVAARERHGAPAVVVDFGTSTNFDVVSAAGEFAGGVLAPGIEISMDALFARAARLPKVPFVAPERVISQTTTAALQSGLVYGFAGPGRRDRRPHPRRARRARRAGRRDGRPRRPDRAALADDHGRRPGADPAGAPARLGAEPAGALSRSTPAPGPTRRSARGRTRCRAGPCRLRTSPCSGRASGRRTRRRAPSRALRRR